MEKMTVSQAKKAISDKLSHFFGVDTKKQQQTLNITKQLHLLFVTDFHR